MERLSELNIDDVENYYKVDNLFDQSKEFTDIDRSFIYVKCTQNIKIKAKMASDFMKDLRNALGLKSIIDDIQFIEQDFKYAESNGVHFLLIKLNRNITLDHIQKIFWFTKNKKKLFSSPWIMIFQDNQFEARVADSHYYDWISQPKQMTVYEAINNDGLNNKEALVRNENNEKNEDKRAGTVHSKDTIALLNDHIRALNNNSGENTKHRNREITNRIDAFDSNMINENSVGFISSVFDQSKKLQSNIPIKSDFHGKIIKKAPDNMELGFYDSKRIKKVPVFADKMPEDVQKDICTETISMVNNSSIQKKPKSQ